MPLINFLEGKPAILIIIFWNITIFEYRSDSPQVKRNFIPSIANLVHELPHEYSNDLRLRILGNYEILEKSQLWVGTKPSAQSLFEKSDFGNSSRKSCIKGYQTFPFLPSITGSLYFVTNTLFRIVWARTFLVLTRPSLLQTSIFWHFL